MNKVYPYMAQITFSIIEEVRENIDDGNSVFTNGGRMIFRNDLLLFIHREGDEYEFFDSAFDLRGKYESSGVPNGHLVSVSVNQVGYILDYVFEGNGARWFEGVDGMKEAIASYIREAVHKLKYDIKRNAEMEFFILLGVDAVEEEITVYYRGIMGRDYEIVPVN